MTSWKDFKEAGVYLIHPPFLVGSLLACNVKCRWVSTSISSKGAVTGRCVDYRSASVLCCFPMPFKCFLSGHGDPPRWLLNALGTVWHHCRGLTCTYPTAWPGIVPTCQTAIEQVILLHPLSRSTRAQIEGRESVLPTPPSEQRGWGGKRGHNRAHITNQDVNHVSSVAII